MFDSVPTGRCCKLVKIYMPPIILTLSEFSKTILVRSTNRGSNRRPNLQTSKASLESQSQDTSLFMRAATN